MDEPTRKNKKHFVQVNIARKSPERQFRVGVCKTEGKLTLTAYFVECMKIPCIKWIMKNKYL
jgi:hypothetical protein